MQKDYEGVQMKSSREQFEEWFYEYTGCDPKDSRYANMVEMYWMAWQASRAAIEIELPAVIWDMSEDGSQHYDREDVIDAIQSVGLKVKS